jgi:hypothetical protein
MARISNSERLTNLHAEALAQFDKIQSALRDERLQCLQDRRFYSLAGAQWEGPLWYQYENKPRLEVNKIALAVQRIFSEYRNNRITVDFIDKDGSKNKTISDICDKLYRADEQDSCAEEAYDNAFEEGVGGGFGAWRLRTEYEDEEDPDNEYQRIKIEPIFDADSSVYFDLNAKRQDKSDAKYCFVLSSMTRESYISEWNDDPTTWPKVVHQYEFDWCTPDVVFVAEMYRVESVKETLHIFQTIDGQEEKYLDSELDGETAELLNAVGTVKVRERKITRRKIHKYIMSGGKVLEDCGYIAGKNIPIVPFYGKRWFVDNVERCSGHVRLAKDAQRLKNMQLSKLAEISALSSVEKPILTPEQVAGHQVMWSEDNIKNYPYLLINPITAADGSTQVGGPVAYTKSAAVPPALAGLLQITEQDIRDVLGNQEQGDKIVSNISGKAVEMVQQRLDMQSYIYISNMAKAIRRCGEIWLSMAQDVYVEDKRRMKGIAEQGEVEMIELMKPTIDDTGAMVYEGDLSNAHLDVAVNVGPSFRSQRQAIVQSLTNLVAITQDPQTQAVLQAMIITNMEGEGLSDAQEFFRKKLVEMGVIDPTEEDMKRMQEAAANAQPDPNAVFVQAAAEKAMADAEKSRADAVLTMAKTEETQAKTIKTLESVGQSGGASTGAATTPAASPVDEYEAVKREFEIEKMRIEMAEKLMKLRQMEQESVKAEVETQSQIDAQSAIADLRENVTETVKDVQEVVQGLVESFKNFEDSVKMLSDSSKEASEKAIEAIKRPKRVIRENGKIVGIETQ